MFKVLITGITGFIGSHIAEDLINHNFEVIGVKRSNSNPWRCQTFADKIEWLNLEDLDEWKVDCAGKFQLMVIHCAWIGVEAKDRDNWLEQAKNINLVVQLVELSNYFTIKKYLFLGSQAEYGLINGKVNESSSALPTSAYGSIKLACLEILRTYSTLHKIDWLWIRVFSVFGEREDFGWLIPSVVRSMQQKNEMDFTGGEQRYAYLYVKDFSKIITTILKRDVESGVYNISTDQVQHLKTLLTRIRDQINPNFKLNFGRIPYRHNQSMHIEGDIAKLVGAIGPFKFTDFNVALLSTLNYYTSNSTNEGI